MKWEAPNSGDPRLEYKPFSNLLPKTEPRDATAVRVTEPVMKVPAGTPMGNEMGPYGTIEQGEGISLIDKLNRQPIVELAQKSMDNPVLWPMMGMAVGSVGQEMLKRAIGRVATNIRVPVGYGAQPNNALQGSSSWKDKLRAIVKDEPLWGYDRKTRGATDLREFPYRKGFGLEPRWGSEYYEQNPNGTWRFSQEGLDRIDDANHVAIKYYGPPEPEQELAVVLGGYKRKTLTENEELLRILDNEKTSTEFYHDVWDFGLNKGEAKEYFDAIVRGRVKQYDLKGGVKSVLKVPFKDRIPMMTEAAMRVGVDLFQDPITIQGFRKLPIMEATMPEPLTRSRIIEKMILGEWR